MRSAVHEIKVKRADPLGDLRRPAKRAAYLQMAGACSHVLAEGIAEPEETPVECGVIVARGVPDLPEDDAPQLALGASAAEDTSANIRTDASPGAL